MEALVRFLAQYFGIDPALLFAAIASEQRGSDDSVDEDDEEGWDEDGGGYWTLNFDLFQPTEP